MIQFTEWMKEPGFYVKQMYDPETNKLSGAGKLGLLPHQERILDHALHIQPDGNTRYTTVIYSCPKKSGKTTIEAAVGNWWGENVADTEIYAIANDIEQVQYRVFMDMGYDVKNKGISNPLKSYIEWPETGTFCRAIAQEYKSAAGSRHSLTLWDELWAYCRTPVLVLTSDLKWVMSDQLKVGDQLVSFDDEVEGTYRSFKTGTVVKHKVINAPTIKVSLEDGSELTGTPVHKVLARRGKRNEVVWVELQDIKPGDRLFKVIEPWDEVHSEEQGYLAVAFDGEGSLCQTKGKGIRIDFAQKDNAMYRQVIKYLDVLGFDFWNNKDNGGTNHDVMGLGTGQKHQVVRFLGSVRPVRLLDKFRPEAIGRLAAEKYVTVTKVEEAGDQKVVAMTVDCGTYIGDGFADHNTSNQSRMMWAELTPVPTAPMSLRFISTYAGILGKSELLEDLYNKVVVNGEVVEELADIVDSNGKPVCFKKGRIFAYWDHEPRMPWQTDDYYEEEMLTLRPSDFLRLHRNEWVTEFEQFIPIEWWKKCETLEGPLTIFQDVKYSKWPITLGVDVGVKHDCSAVTGVYYDSERGKVGLAFHRIWTPTEGNPLDLETTVEQYILEMNSKFNISAVVYDPTNFHRSMVTLRDKSRINMVEYPQTGARMEMVGQAFFDAIKGKYLEVYQDDELTDHIKYTTAENKGRGFRLVKGDKMGKPIDASIALAMAVHYAIETGGVDVSKPIVLEVPFASASGWKPKPFGEDNLPWPFNTPDRR